MEEVVRRLHVLKHQRKTLFAAQVAAEAVSHPPRRQTDSARPIVENGTSWRTRGNTIGTARHDVGHWTRG
jgi:hypothetical protein